MRTFLFRSALAALAGTLCVAFAPAEAAEPSAGGAAAAAPDMAPRIGHSGLPVPRFVALKKDEVYGRFGPGQDYPVAAVYRRAELPVRVIAETRDDVWRRIEDADGQKVWIHRSMLKANDHALILGEAAVLRAEPEEGARGRAKLAGGVVTELLACEAEWCRVKAGDYKGWLPKDALWGAPQS